ncbi:MAG: DTW domain-containing protein, partial [Comamonas sp.]
LQDVGDSGYAIRKAHLPGQLSSFEAAVLGLAQLQNWPPGSAAPATLTQVFEQFVARQILQQNANQAPQGA